MIIGGRSFWQVSNHSTWCQPTLILHWTTFSYYQSLGTVSNRSEQLRELNVPFGQVLNGSKQLRTSLVRFCPFYNRFFRHLLRLRDEVEQNHLFPVRPTIRDCRKCGISILPQSVDRFFWTFNTWYQLTSDRLTTAGASSSVEMMTPWVGDPFPHGDCRRSR